MRTLVPIKPLKLNNPFLPFHRSSNPIQKLMDLSEIDKILSNTPDLLKTLILGNPEELYHRNEGPNTWSPHEIIRHLNYCEEEDWVPRIKVILDGSKTFPPFDRFAHLEIDKNESMETILEKFRSSRERNLDYVRSLNLDQSDLEKTGIHPEFGEVGLEKLIGAWAAHDLSHLGQLARVMGKQLKEEAGPWTKYMRIFNQ